MDARTHYRHDPCDAGSKQRAPKTGNIDKVRCIVCLSRQIDRYEFEIELRQRNLQLWKDRLDTVVPR